MGIPSVVPGKVGTIEFTETSVVDEILESLLRCFLLGFFAFNCIGRHGRPIGNLCLGRTRRLQIRCGLDHD